MESQCHSEAAAHPHCRHLTYFLWQLQRRPPPAPQSSAPMHKGAKQAMHTAQGAPHTQGGITKGSPHAVQPWGQHIPMESNAVLPPTSHLKKLLTIVDVLSLMKMGTGTVPLFGFLPLRQLWVRWILKMHDYCSMNNSFHVGIATLVHFYHLFDISSATVIWRPDWKIPNMLKRREK